MEPARDEKETRTYIPYKKKLIALAIVVVMVVAGFATYYAVVNQAPKGKTLVVYTYSSLFEYGKNNTTEIFAPFEKEYNVNIILKREKIGLVQALSQTNTPHPDVVIGLDNLNGQQAVQDGLLVKYTSSARSCINSTLYSEMGSAAAYLTPYEYSDLGIDYNTSFVNNSSFTPSFENLVNNQTLASNLLLENPTTDSYGQQFLLWEIAYYKYILNETWTTWWTDIKPFTEGHIYDDWTSAFASFGSGENTNMIVSSLTDPAYYNYFNYGNTTNSTVTYHNGTPYGWRTIYGLGIVNGSNNTALGKKFIDYFLSPTVQSQIATNEWNYPANSTIALPPCYSVAPDQNNIQQLNEYLNATAISQNLKRWDTEWLTVMQ